MATAAVVVPAAIKGAADVASGVMGGKGAKAAAQTQLQGTREALAFQREQEANRKAEYDKAMAAYQSQWNAWNANRMALLQR